MNPETPSNEQSEFISNGGDTNEQESRENISQEKMEPRPSPSALRDGELDLLLQAYEHRSPKETPLPPDESAYVDQLNAERQTRVNLAEKLEGKETVEQIREGVWLLSKERSVNPVSVVFRRGNELVVTDPGVSWKSREKNRDLKELGASLSAKVSGVMLTHSHPDHIGNLPEVTDKDTPVYVHPKGFWSLRSPGKLLEAENVLAQRGKAPKLFPQVVAERLYPLVMKASYGPRLTGMKKQGENIHRVTDEEGNTQAIPVKEGGRRYQRFPEKPFQFDGYTVEVIETPGHTPGEVSFWIPEDRILVGGDLIPNTHVERDNIASLYMPEANIYEAISSLEKIKALNPRLFIPSHGEPIRSQEALQERIGTMLSLLRVVVEKVQTIRSERPETTVQQLADEVFADDPRFPKTSKFGPIEKRTIVMSVLRDKSKE